MTAMEEGKKTDSASARSKLIRMSNSKVLLEWHKLIMENAETPRLARVLACSKLDISRVGDVLSLRFYVANEAQKQWIETHKISEFETRLREYLDFENVRLEVENDPVKAKENEGDKDFLRVVELLGRARRITSE